MGIDMNKIIKKPRTHERGKMLISNIAINYSLLSISIL